MNRFALIVSCVLLVSYAGYVTYTLQQAPSAATLAANAVEQVENSDAAYTQLREQLRGVNPLALPLLIVGLVAVWLPAVLSRVRLTGKPKRGMQTATLLLPLIVLAACKPYNRPDIIEIGPNETAFVVPLSGDTTSQTQFQSVAFLESNQVATKRIIIPKEEFQTGRLYYEVQYIPTVRVIVVDRTPVTREWTSSSNTGTANINQAFGVESAESIDFRVGATCSARVDEENAAKFLYYFSGRTLDQVMDQNVRGFIQAELFSEFGSLRLEDGQRQKGEIFARVYERAVEHFAPLGVTITSLGGSEGLMYNDPNVQAVINQNFEAEQAEVRAAANATAQALENQTYIEQQRAQIEGRATAQALENLILVESANAAATATVVAGQASAEVLRVQGEQLGQYPGLVDYEIAQRSSGQVPQILFMGDQGGSGELPFSFFLNPNDVLVTPTPGS